MPVVPSFSIEGEEYETAMYLTTTDSTVRLSDFIVMQLLRQGKISPETVKVLKQNFDAIDTDSTGSLTLEQATFIMEHKES